jgi:hypothetical protein
LGHAHKPLGRRRAAKDVSYLLFIEPTSGIVAGDDRVPG